MKNDIFKLETMYLTLRSPILLYIKGNRTFKMYILKSISVKAFILKWHWLVDWCRTTQ